LLGNAFKFSPPNGCIDLKVEVGPPGQPSVPSHVANPITASNVLRIVVKDYGCGIAPAALQNVFQPFVQAGEDTAKAYEGTGLGLAIASKLTKNLGGCVYAHSTVGVGSEFIVEFPFEQEQFFNVQALGERLANTTCLIVPGPHLPQVLRLKQMLDTYQVSYRILESMDDLDRIRLQDNQSDLTPLDSPDSSQSTATMDESSNIVHFDAIVLPPDRTYVCWIDESVYQRDVMQRFQLEVEHAETTSLLWTVGPAYAVAEGSHHFRNLLQMVPSVLMQRLAEEVEELFSSRRQPSFNSQQGLVDSTAPKHTRRVSNRHRIGQKKLKTSLQNLPTETRDKEDVAILIVEDNVINQKVLRALLKKLGYTHVTVVSDGQQAVDAVARDNYDVVLMDVQMPVMNGLEATRVIVGRQQESEELPKIVFVTATVDQSLEEEAKELGAVGFVPKPFNLRQLEACMIDLCRSIPVDRGSHQNK
jgi:CheY-like chemotaxis protein